MSPYITFSIKGLHGILVSGDSCQFDANGMEKIASIELLQNDSEIIGLKTNFAEDTVIDDALVNSTYKLIELFLVSLFGEYDARAEKLQIDVDCICDYNSSEKKLSVNRRLSLDGLYSVSYSYTLSPPINEYKKIFTQIPGNGEKQDLLIILLNIMKIDNLAVRYLVQYEFLKSSIKPFFEYQKDFVDFIRTTYNPTLKANKIDLRKTRQPNKNYEVDDFTYLRNLLAHPDIKEKPTIKEIREKSAKIMKVIFFKISMMQ